MAGGGAHLCQRTPEPRHQQCEQRGHHGDGRCQHDVVTSGVALERAAAPRGEEELGWRLRTDVNSSRCGVQGAVEGSVEGH